MVPKFAYSKPATVTEAIKELTADSARILSGGSDLLGCLRDGVFKVDKVVSLSGINDLDYMKKRADGGLEIGSMVHITTIAEDEYISENYPTLSAATKVIASPQLRNQGTIGGNICQRPRCWYYRGDFHCAKKGGEMCYAYDGENVYHAIFGGDPCFIVHPSDSAPALMAERAKVRIAGPNGVRSVPMEEFFVLPDEDLYNENILKQNEVVVAIELPPPTNGLKGTYTKIRTRESWDFAIVSVAVSLKLEGDAVSHARIVLGGVAPKPWRVPQAEKTLVGKKLNADSAAEVAEKALQDAQPLAQNAYKIDMAKGAVQQALLSLM